MTFTEHSQAVAWNSLSNELYGLQDSCKIIPYSKSESTTTTSSTHIPSDSYYTDETDSCQSQRDISAKTKIMQNRRRKQCKKDKVTVPCGSFILSVDKPCQSIKLNLKGMRERLSIKDLRMLLLSWLADGARPSWIQLKKSHHSRRFVAVHIPGFDCSAFGIQWDNHTVFTKTYSLSKSCAYIDHMPFTSNLFDEVISLKSANKDHPAAEFCQCPISNSERQRRAHARRANFKLTTEYTPDQCMLTLDEMLEAGYPIHSTKSGHSSTPMNWVETQRRDQSDVEKRRRMIALDCEMCLTKAGLELARISLIDENLDIIMDEMVQPAHPIIDYLTQYSGIREETLAGVTTTLGDIQQQLLQIIDQDTILVGHSLECDLKALRIAHPNVIDTSRLYHHQNGPPLRPSLKYLAARWLNRVIQTNEDAMPDHVINGHDPCVDAMASMELVQLKLERGPDFGLYFSSSESIFSRLERCRPARLGAVFETLGSLRPSPYTQYAQLVRRCDHDDQLVDELINCVHQYDFIWAGFHDVSLEHTADDAHIRHPISPPQKFVKDYHIDSSDHALARLDDRLRRLYNSLPVGTVLAVIGSSKVDDRLSRSPPLTPTSDSPDLDLNRQMNSFCPNVGICLLTAK